jgi:flagellar biosynthesis protein FliP
VFEDLVGHALENYFLLDQMLHLTFLVIGLLAVRVFIKVGVILLLSLMVARP